MKQEMEIKRESIGQDDSIIIKKFFKGLEGGRTLNIPADTKNVVVANKVTTTTEILYPSTLKAGTPIIKTTRTIAGQQVEVYEPIAIKKVTREYAESYSLSASKAGKTEVSISYDVEASGATHNGQTYVGILQSSILKSKPAAAIMTNGVVNPAVEGNYLTSGVQGKIREACPFIDFQVDEEA